MLSKLGFTCAFASLYFLANARYTPDWASVDSRPLPSWFDDAKFGIFIHWGVFSVPSFKTEWYWWNLNGSNPDPETVAFHERVYGKDFKYQDFADQFKAEMWDPAAWANMFKNAGAKYVVLTSKHHEGFTNWPSSVSWNWNSMDVGPHRDLVGELSEAVREAGLTMGLYHSLFEWFHPLYLADKAANFTSRSFVESKTMPELKEIVEKYKPDLIWSDGDWEADSVSYWKSPEFLAWLYNDSPVKDTVVTNDRWGQGCSLKHGGYYSGGDRQQPGPELLGHKWENCMTIDGGSWGYSRKSNLAAYLSTTQILRELASTVAYGGNLLLNVGPTKDGLILPIFEERLSQVGAFLHVNGAAIYGTTPFSVQEEKSIEGAVYTASRASPGTVFLTVVQKQGTWPAPGTVLKLEALKSITSGVLLTASQPVPLNCSQTGGHVECTVPCPFKAGLSSGNVSGLGFSLKFEGAVQKEISDKVVI